jgi:hypothetical protein
VGTILTGRTGVNHRPQVTVIPGIARSDAAWQLFGWLDGGHRLIVTAGLNTQPGTAQAACW